MNEAMIKEQIKFYEEKKISWLDVAPHIILAVEEEFDFESIDFDRRKVSEIIRAYNFLEAQRPESLKNPNTKKISPDFISYLPVIFKRMNNIERETEFQGLIDKVLKSEISRNELRDLSKKLKLKKDINSNGVKRIVQVKKDNLNTIVGEFYTVDVLRSTIKILSYMIDKAREELPIQKLRDLIGEESRDLANELQCIADEEFEKLWNERKEFQV